MNGLNESDVTKVTCVTNVTCVKNVACVTNEFDETRFLSLLQSGASRHLRGRIAFQTDISTYYSAPSQKPNGKAQKRVCQNVHFGFTLKGASEWLRCKALRMRAQGVY